MISEIINKYSSVQLEQALKLRRQIEELEAQVSGNVQQAVQLTAENPVVPAKASKMTDEAKAKIARAQRKRWKLVRLQKAKDAATAAKFRPAPAASQPQPPVPLAAKAS